MTQEQLKEIAALPDGEERMEIIRQFARDEFFAKAKLGDTVRFQSPSVYRDGKWVPGPAGGFGYGAIFVHRTNATVKSSVWIDDPGGLGWRECDAADLTIVWNNPQMELFPATVMQLNFRWKPI